MNKPRLIDANKLLRYLNDWWFSETPNGTVLFINGEPQTTVAMAFIEQFMKAVENQPTAYDIDKVVERLEELSPENECFDFEEDYIYAEKRHNRYIEIVKGGGLDE